MATQTPTYQSTAGDSLPREESRPDFGSLLNSILMPLASLKLTVVLFALSILIVLFGTLAQASLDIWDVIDQYFRVDLSKVFTSSFPWIHPGQLFVRVPFQIFFPPAFTQEPRTVPGWFPFPKGWVIGLVMAFNLLAAHTVRFKSQAKGSRLVAGLFVLAFGVFATWAVIVSGSDKDGVQTAYSVSWEMLWRAMQFSLIGLVLTMGYGLFSVDPEKKWHRNLLILGVSLATPLLVWMFWSGSAVPIDDSGMRILWQLVKGTLAGVILLIGCILVFRKRAGIVLLHSGIGLMMFYEVLVGVSADEAQMHIVEGQTVQYASDIREVELAVTKSLDEKTEQVTVVPYSILKDYRPEAKNEEEAPVPGELLSDEQLPFDIRIEEYYENSELEVASGTDQAKVTGGFGKEARPKPIPTATGAGSSERSDQPSAYVAFYEKGNPEKLISRNLLALEQGLADIPEVVEVGDETYNVYLRYKRNYKPYSVTLTDVSKEDYEGTSTPRDYSSEIILKDSENDQQLEARVWMNNPLRYGGETFYQSNYGMLRDGREFTALSVVTNTGWMIPYVSCMIVAVGMLAQFLMTLTRFLNRRVERVVPRENIEVSGRAQPVFDSEPALGKKQGMAAIWFPLAAALLVTVGLSWTLIVPSAEEDEINYYAFGQIPVSDKGRLKPVDSLARNTLRFLSKKVDFKDLNKKRQPATRFLLDLMTPVKKKAPESGEMTVVGTQADGYRVFYIESLEAQKFLDLDRRKGFLYSYNELQPNLEKLDERMATVFAKMRGDAEGHPDLLDHDLREVYSKLQEYYRVRESFLPKVAIDIPTPAEFDRDPQEAIQKIQEIRQLREIYPEYLAKLEAALLTPEMNLPEKTPEEFEPDYAGQWMGFPEAVIENQIQDFLGRPANPLAGQFEEIREVYAEGETKKFNKAVAGYLAFLHESPPPGMDESRITYEAYFNKTSIYFWALFPAIVAFILGLCSWIGWSEPFRRAAFLIILVLLVFHTYGLISRIYISGRPPVTNLYSSAIFIGWGAMALGLLLEWLHPIGVAVVISAAMSFGTLLIAQFLSIGGDTIGVLQAVLDTQFWLATHVVCITFGYATTFVAGFLGIAYFVRGMLTPTLTKSDARDLIRMIYGILCFSIFFSFVGTVLGGLWADDSWGRFWGWDPKENGALIIVLWNSLVLHARWGGLVKDRGLAVLAMGGNIATSWSWFGVNELGVGLHSYGFTKGVLFALSAFCIVQMLMILIAAAVPQKEWWSFRRQRLEASR